MASFKIVQETKALTTVFVIPGAGFRTRRWAHRAGLKRRLGESVAIDVKLEDEIPPRSPANSADAGSACVAAHRVYG